MSLFFSNICNLRISWLLLCVRIWRRKVLCVLPRRLFTVSALDNSPSPSTTAMSAYHGTGMSLLQSPTRSSMGHTQDGIACNLNKQRISNCLITTPLSQLSHWIMLWFQNHPVRLKL